MIIIKDLIKDVVDSVSTDLTPILQEYDSTITGVHYMAGHPLEITQRLTERGNDNVLKYSKYPLVGLLMDIPEQHGVAIGYFNVRLNLIIARSTGSELIVDQRYEKNFIPVLYPIYEALMNKLVTFSYGKYKPFNNSSVQQLRHDKFDRVFWGKESFMSNTSNYFKDYIDAIEIRNLELSVNLKNC
jgi:hypothetical protein